MGTERHPRVQLHDRLEIQDGREYRPSTSGATHPTLIFHCEFRQGPISEFLEWFGDLGIFFWQVLRAGVTPPFEFRELFSQLDEIGSKSLPLVALAGAATGVVLSLEARYSLARFGAKSLRRVQAVLEQTQFARAAIPSGRMLGLVAEKFVNREGAADFGESVHGSHGATAVWRAGYLGE